MISIPADMKKNLIALLGILIQFSGFSQSQYKTIKISDDIKLIKLSEQVYIHVSYANLADYGRTPENGLIFIEGNKAFVFDSPWNDSQTKTLFSWLTDSMKLEIKGFVPNHWHNDCLGGLGYILQQKIETYANQMTIDIARFEKRPLPQHGFKDSLSLKLGNKAIKCYYLGAAHTLDNIVVWIPSESILFAGCMIKSLSSKDLGNTADGDLKAYPGTIKKLIAKFPEAKLVIPGHGDPGGVELITHTLDLLNKNTKPDSSTAK
jgi:metallo-beta-lactamase class B